MLTSTRTFLVVGDRFDGFAVQDGVVTVSQFLRQLRAGIALDGGPMVIQAGQGVSADEWIGLREQADRLGAGDCLDFRERPSQLANEAEVHKRADTNTLIANLERAGEDLFTASLRVHNDNELLLDHQTGQHVQGMVAIEAARQMFLAVSERFFACRYPDKSYYYVIESMNTDFENFLFPLDATVEFKTVRAAVTDPGRLAFLAEISILQSGSRTSCTSVAYSAFDSAVIGAKEHRRARRAVLREAGAPAEALAAS